MKNSLLILFLVLGFNVFSQTHQIIKHDNESRLVNFIKDEDNLIYYSYIGSFEEHKISSYAVATLKSLQSSEVKTISSKISIASKSDYNKVKVLQHEDNAIGLKKVTIFKGQLNRAKGISSFEQFENTIRNVKYKAADKHLPFVVINKKTNGTYEAIAYTY
jgi:hypothetical protein